MWIKVRDRPPPPYTDVLVVHNGVKKVLRHESGWWYGLCKKDEPCMWYTDDKMISLLLKARNDLDAIQKL